MLERFRKNTFRHGVHPPEMKDDTAGLAIRQFPFAPVLIVPLSQHLGKPARPVVREGQEVIRGQTIAVPDGFMSVAMHAPASGIVRRIILAPNISGTKVESVYIEPYPASTQEIDDGEPCGLDATPDEILDTPGLTSVTLWADDVTTTDAVDVVWAVITPPGYDPGACAPLLPMLELQPDTPHDYQAIYLGSGQ